ncbi:NAD-dependent epimerase/dehydratase family protein [Pedobacter cryoconitis]|uniref:Nucleoside-diphosphate-sugar epimerase n=1 Tax=Pedobacter cryoconitis TaxID=188932 RepID=A0A7X0MHV0_9SPHI|nr:NAD(P)-dependent oxidoreductase [Pedobacter cryoconitis]MBB6499246.1 nucleoside-diphosphate-sugar epimerase [Pedobacter cryoconitis]
MRILVTGSSGQLGSVTVNHLRNHGHEVTGIDLIAHPSTDLIIDITNPTAVEQVTRNMEAVIHTAAIHGKHYDLNYPREDFINVNIKGTLHLLNACVKNKITQFLYISTTSIYGNSMVNPGQAVWVDETLQEQPRDIYDITKQCAEQLCKDFFKKEGLQTSVYRVGRFLPENDNLKINHRVYRGLDERDGAEALRLALIQEFDQFEVFNISAGSPFQKEDLVLLKKAPQEIIKRYYPDADRIYQEKGWSFPESIDRVYIADKAKHILGYQPRYTFGFLLYHSE